MSLRLSRVSFIVVAAAVLLPLTPAAGAPVPYNLTGAWSTPGTHLVLAQSGNTISWTGGPDNRAWIQTFKGTLASDPKLGTIFTGTFQQDEPGRSPPRYHGTMKAQVEDSCHFRFITIEQAGMPTIGNILFTKSPCPASAPVVWPPLPDALVALESVSNGCGGGPAGNDPKYGDDSEFVDSEIPFADVGSWNHAKKYRVDFREACKQHDAGYSHAKVHDMKENGGGVIDYFSWTKARVDAKFLVDMRKLCDAQVPAPATVALRNCKQNGGFHLVSGAKSRYDIVAATTYTQKIWSGLGFYQEPPHLSGTWTVAGVSTGAWSIVQSSRRVTAKWTGGAGQASLKGEFRGTIVSHDADSSIEGFYVITGGAAQAKPRPMTLVWSPKAPDRLRVSTGFALQRG